MSIININSDADNKFIKKTNNDVKNQPDQLNLQKNFLSLLIAQIKNQDPTDPIKNTELTSQLAQINTVMGIEKLNNTVNSFSDQIKKNQNIQVSSLIGHHVMIRSKNMIHTQGIETKYGIKLFSYADSVKISIEDNDGKVIYLNKIKNVQPGVHIFSFNDKNLNNTNTSAEKYNIVVEAKNKDKKIDVIALNEAVINSIIKTSGDPVIDLGPAGRTTLSQIPAILK